ncbi:hypothetical protein TSAR_002260, partial [Trichomalopsis sarcophagae]
MNGSRPDKNARTRDVPWHIVRNKTPANLQRRMKSTCLSRPESAQQCVKRDATPPRQRAGGYTGQLGLDYGKLLRVGEDPDSFPGALRNVSLRSQFAYFWIPEVVKHFGRSRSGFESAKIVRRREFIATIENFQLVVEHNKTTAISTHRKTQRLAESLSSSTYMYPIGENNYDRSVHLSFQDARAIY